MHIAGIHVPQPVGAGDTLTFPQGTAIRLIRILQTAPRRGSAPEDLPQWTFDLVVASEVLYYFSPEELAGVLDALDAVMPRGATLLAVHWRGLGTHRLTGDQVHAVLRARPGLVRTHGEVHESYLLDRFECR